MSIIVSTKGKEALVAGLSWYPLVGASAKARKAEIQGILDQAEGVKKIALENAEHGAIGLYIPIIDELEGTFDPSSDKAAKPSKMYSLALMFAKLLNGMSAVLLYRHQLLGDKVLIVVADAGRPILDVVKNAEDVAALAHRYRSGEEGPIYTVVTNADDLVHLADQAITNEQLWQRADKASLLIAKPINLGRIALISGLLVAAACGTYVYQDYAAEAKKAKALEDARRNDPTLLYQQALAVAMPSIGVTTPQVLSVLDALGSQVQTDSGWLLKTIECKASSKDCQSVWARSGGTSSELISSRSRYSESVVQQNGLDEMRFSLPLKNFVASGIQTADVLPEQSKSETDAVVRYQKLSNAGIAVALANGGYALWPSQPNPPRTGAVLKRKLTFSTTMPLMRDALGMFGKNTFWDTLTLKAEVATKPGDTMKITIEGAEYVR